MTGHGVKIQAKVAEQCQYQQFDFLNQNPLTLEFNNATSDLVAQKQAKHIQKINVLGCLDGTYNEDRYFSSTVRHCAESPLINSSPVNIALFAG